MNSIRISPDFSGVMVPQDVLRSDRLMGFKADCPLRDAFFFEVNSTGFHFKFWAEGGVLKCVRNETEVSFPCGMMTEKLTKVEVQICWSPTAIAVGIRRIQPSRHIWGERADTPPTLPPASLIRWARQNNLLPVHSYSTEGELRQKVYSLLESIQDKVSELSRSDLLWDIEREGNGIVSRRPKREPDLNSFVYAALHDGVMMAGLDLAPEYKTGVGDVDFVFSGSVDKIGVCQICLEAKCAQSPDLISGLAKQLPCYMANKNLEYGAYLVYWFKGQWFEQPAHYSSPDNLERELIRIRLTSLPASPRLEGVRVFVLDLSKPTVASRSEDGVH